MYSKIIKNFFLKCVQYVFIIELLSPNLLSRKIPNILYKKVDLFIFIILIKILIKNMKNEYKNILHKSL